MHENLILPSTVVASMTAIEFKHRFAFYSEDNPVLSTDNQYLRHFSEFVKVDMFYVESTMVNDIATQSTYQVVKLYDSTFWESLNSAKKKVYYERILRHLKMNDTPDENGVYTERTEAQVLAHLPPCMRVYHAEELRRKMSMTELVSIMEESQSTLSGLKEEIIYLKDAVNRLISSSPQASTSSTGPQNIFGPRASTPPPSMVFGSSPSTGPSMEVEPEERTSTGSQKRPRPE